MSETKVLCGWLLVGAVFLLPDSWLLTVSSCGERALMSLFIKALIPLGGPTLMTLSNPNHLPKAHLKVSSHWRLGV